jgi:hypothetical protein
LKGFTFGGGSIGVEADRECFNQGRSVGPLQGVEPGMVLADVPAGQPYSYRPVQPARSRGQGGQQRLRQDQALTRGRDRPKPQFASLIPAVQYHSPAKSRTLVPIPIEHPDQLIA